MKKMSLLIAATFAASLFAGAAAAQMGSAGSPADQPSGSQSDQMKAQDRQMQQQSGQSQQQMGEQAQSQTKQSQQLSSDEIRQVQQQLQAQGHDPGGIDGKMGPKTAKAIREFQQAQGITASGQPDSQTLQALGVQRQGQEEFMGVSPGFESEQQKQQQQDQLKMDQERQQQESIDQMDSTPSTPQSTPPGGSGAQ